MAPWFNVRKAAQVAAFFALREQEEIYVLKLVKLMYLADRKFMELYDVPILRDQLVSMPHGPVNSLCYNYINGSLVDEQWDEFLSDREAHKVGLSQDDLTEDALDELSPAERRVLQEVWNDIGHMGRFDLVKYTHENCPEWEDPNGSSNPIPYSRVFNFLQKRNSGDLGERVVAERHLATSFT